MPLAPVGPVMVIAEVIPKALAPEVLSPEVDKLMVAAPPAVRLAANTMVSAPGLMVSLLAKIMASRRVPPLPYPLRKLLGKWLEQFCLQVEEVRGGKKLFVLFYFGSW